MKNHIQQQLRKGKTEQSVILVKLRKFATGSKRRTFSGAVILTHFPSPKKENSRVQSGRLLPDVVIRMPRQIEQKAAQFRGFFFQTQQREDRVGRERSQQRGRRILS